MVFKKLVYLFMRNPILDCFVRQKFRYPREYFRYRNPFIFTSVSERTMRYAWL